MSAYEKSCFVTLKKRKIGIKYVFLKVEINCCFWTTSVSSKPPFASVRKCRKSPEKSNNLLFIAVVIKYSLLEKGACQKRRWSKSGSLFLLLNNERSIHVVVCKQRERTCHMKCVNCHLAEMTFPPYPSQLQLILDTHYPYIRAVCTGVYTGRIYGRRLDTRIYGPYIRAVLVPKYHCRAKNIKYDVKYDVISTCLLYTSPSPRDRTRSRMPSSA